MSAIERSKKIQYFVYSDLLIYSLAFLLSKIAYYVMDNNETRMLILSQTRIIGAITYIIFVCVFCFELQRVNL